ncbi:MAG: hypothetical protein IJQ21_06395, partial [Lachnospiraceae bacterium]|nr:hypothetical protein [Lachnospiraceae bacterium]
MIKRLRDLMLSPDTPIQEKMYLLGGCVGSIFMTLLFLVILLTGQSFLVASALGAGAIVLVGATWYSYKTGN